MALRGPLAGLLPLEPAFSILKPATVLDRLKKINNAGLRAWRGAARFGVLSATSTLVIKS
jgi:hypothetical protein